MIRITHGDINNIYRECALRSILRERVCRRERDDAPPALTTIRLRGDKEKEHGSQLKRLIRNISSSTLR